MQSGREASASLGKSGCGERDRVCVEAHRRKTPFLSLFATRMRTMIDCERGHRIGKRMGPKGRGSAEGQDASL